MRKTREVKGRIAVTDKICVETRRGDERDRAGEGAGADCVAVKALPILHLLLFKLLCSPCCPSCV